VRDLLEAFAAASFVRDRELLGRTEVVPGDAPVEMGDLWRKRHHLFVVRGRGVEVMLHLEPVALLESGSRGLVEGLQGEGGRLGGENQGGEHERRGPAGRVPSLLGHDRVPLRAG
jgi:hypothetical protein